MSTINLFSPGRIDGFDTPNRIVMAPMTRCRASQDGVPSELAIGYYAQRSSAALIITEGTSPSIGGSGYARTPSLYSPEQVVAWRKITDAVHAKGGRIFVQLMHVGRIGHSANRLTTDSVVAPSAIRAAGKMWTDSLGMQDNDLPRALEADEIPVIIEEFAHATRNAMEAGFDGVELHSASGYLPMQFLSSGTNQRMDAYGGSAQNRIRFVLETLQVMIAAAGDSQKIGIKISPGMPFNDCTDDNPVETYSALVEAISPLNLAYLHIMRSQTPARIVETLRPLFKGTLLAGGGFNKQSGDEILTAHSADFVVFGVLFVANPDLPERFAHEAPLNQPDPTTFYTPGPKGYTDYGMVTP